VDDFSQYLIQQKPKFFFFADRQGLAFPRRSCKDQTCDRRTNAKVSKIFNGGEYPLILIFRHHLKANIDPQNAGVLIVQIEAQSSQRGMEAGEISLRLEGKDETCIMM
jgi:hypothetical protein